MKLRDTLALATAEAGVEPRVLKSLLDRLVHDLNSPLGTLTLELFNGEQVVDHLGHAVDVGDQGNARRFVGELEEIHANLALARERALGIVGVLQECAAELEGEDETPPGRD